MSDDVFFHAGIAPPASSTYNNEASSRTCGSMATTTEGSASRRSVLSRTSDLYSKRTLRFVSNVKATPAGTFMGEAMEELSGLDRLQRGIRVQKITSRGSLKPRTLTLSKDRFALLITHRPIPKQNLRRIASKIQQEQQKQQPPYRPPKETNLETSLRKFTMATSSWLSRNCVLHCWTLCSKSSPKETANNATTMSPTAKSSSSSWNQSKECCVQYLDVADWNGVQVGFVGTRKCELARTKNRLKGIDSLIDIKAEQIVTIWHHGDQTLNVLVPKPKDRTALVDGFQRVHAAYHAATKQQRLGVPNNEALLLRYIWYDVDLNRDGGIGPKEFTALLQRINFHVPNAEQTYHEYLRNVQDLALQQHQSEHALPNHSCSSPSSSSMRNLVQKYSRRFRLGPKLPDSLTYSQIMELLQQLKSSHQTPSVTQSIWDTVFPGRDDVSLEDFWIHFLRRVQGMTRTLLHEAHDISVSLVTMEILQNNKHHVPTKFEEETLGWTVTPAQLELYLFDPILNDAYDHDHTTTDDDLSQPLSRYWINSSHNTYLVGDQWTSASSVEMYMQALRRGCKCLEIDVWDGEIDKQGKCLPVVYHGYTITGKLLFADVLRGIQAYLQSNPHTYPLILSLENHCSPIFQESMAEDLKCILGDALYRPHSMTVLPSPLEMKGKIILKGKRPSDLEEGSDYCSDIELDPAKLKSKQHRGGIKIVPALAQLTLFHGTNFQDLQISKPVSHMHSLSEAKMTKLFLPQKSQSSQSLKMWRRYNTNHLTRTYPSARRVDSSNYNPLTAWATGCQLVALNFQTLDVPLILNDGRFRSSSGYILKPTTTFEQEEGHSTNTNIVVVDLKQPQPAIPEDSTIMMTMTTAPHPCSDEIKLHQFLQDGATLKEDAGMKLQRFPDRQEPNLANLPETSLQQPPMVHPMQIRIRVLAGSCLPKPYNFKPDEILNPSVEVTLHDFRTDANGKVSHVSTSFSTAVMDQNGFCPVWKEATIMSFVVEHPDVAMLHFSLHDTNSTTTTTYTTRVAEAAIPCDRLRQGYRSIALYDLHNTRSGAFGFASLLVEIQKMATTMTTTTNITE